MDKCTIIVGYSNTLLSVVDRSSRQETSKDGVYMSSKINQLVLIDIYRTFQTTTFFSMKHSPK